MDLENNSKSEIDKFYSNRVIKMKKGLSVSVIIPCYNSGITLSRTIEALLNQTKIPDEIIIVDDGSTDNSLSIAQSFGSPVRVIHQENSGAATARHKGVLESKGEFIIFNDAGDVSRPRRIELLHNAIIEYPNCIASFGVTWNMQGPEPLYVTHNAQLLDGKTYVIENILETYLGQSWPLAVGMNLGIIREVAIKSTNISSFYRAANDYALQINTATYGPFASVAEICLDYEETIGGISSSNGWMLQKAYAFCAAHEAFKEQKNKSKINSQTYRERLENDWPELAFHLLKIKKYFLFRKVIKIGLTYGRLKKIPSRIWWILNNHKNKNSTTTQTPHKTTIPIDSR